MANFLASLAVLPALLGLGACTSLLEKDFEKATLVSEVQLGNPNTYTRTFVPPAGTARLILAVPNYRCAAPPDGPLSISVRVAGKTVLSERRQLSDLTWSYGEGSCDAYGYIPGDAGRVDLRDRTPVTFEFDVSQIKGQKQEQIIAAAWLIYGDRVPAARIFGERK